MASTGKPSKKPAKKKDEVAEPDAGRTPDPVNAPTVEAVTQTTTSSATATPPVESTMPEGTSRLDDDVPRTIDQMAPHISLFKAEPGGRPRDEIDVPFALARQTDDGKGERTPDPPDRIVEPEGVPKEG